MKRILFLLIIALAPIIAMAQNTCTASAYVQGRTVQGALYKPSCSQAIEGTVVVSIKVDQYGSVTEAVAGGQGTTITDSALWNAAQNAAMKVHFNASSSAPAIQDGAISYVFEAPKAEHLKFKGIPIDGPVDDFVGKLEDMGYVQTSSSDDKVVLEGVFAGFSKCDISVYFTDNNVWAVVVALPSLTKWESTKSRYNDLKASLKDKYNVSPNCTEKVNESKTDAEIVNQFSEEKATWKSYYNLPLGTIMLWVGNTPFSFIFPSFTVYICYRDNINFQASRDSAYDDL